MSNVCDVCGAKDVPTNSRTSSFRRDALPRQRASTITPPEDATVYCTNFYGSVKTPKICMDVTMNCKYFRGGCPYLHCRHKSHWQFGNFNKWYNFHLYHSQILDTKFSDPNCEGIILPKLNFSLVKGSQKKLISVMGKRNLIIDFNIMTLYCESTDTTYSIRNLTTASFGLAENKDDIGNYTVFKWYFKDDNGLWMLYDNSDSSSALIEKAYVTDSSNRIKFLSDRFSYTIDFTQMTQRNISTNKWRPLRRRAYKPRINKTSTAAKNKNFEEKVQMPKTWDDMKTENVRLVKLKVDDQEYIDIYQGVSFSLPQINVFNIWRVQSLFLWQKFINKQNALEKQYNDKFLDVKKLYYGITSESVDDIIRENLEFRQNSISRNRPYGEGTYFYIKASDAAKFCRYDKNWKKKLLIVEVIIGKVARGSEGITRPPLNKSYNALYDSTTDSRSNPTLYVKYSSLEYYPSYIVEFEDFVPRYV